MPKTPHRLDLVASAIAKGRGLVFSTMDDLHRREWLLDARNALEAIREASNSMIARADALDHDTVYEDIGGAKLVRAAPEDVWRAMISELLE